LLLKLLPISSTGHTLQSVPVVNDVLEEDVPVAVKSSQVTCPIENWTIKIRSIDKILFIYLNHLRNVNVSKGIKSIPILVLNDLISVT